MISGCVDCVGRGFGYFFFFQAEDGIRATSVTGVQTCALPILITTSGTAAANLHPAVLEASHSHLPLMVITADRPQSMINAGANQTTQQAQLFGSHVRTST